MHRGIAHYPASGNDHGRFERCWLRNLWPLPRRRQRGRGRLWRYCLSRPLATIIGDKHRWLLFNPQCLIVLDPDTDCLRQFCAPIILRNQAAFTALSQEASFDENSGNSRQAQDSEARPLYSAIELGDVTEQRVIDANGERHALGVDLAAGLHAKRAGSCRVIGGGWRSARSK